MSDLPIGNVPTSTLNDTDNILFAEGAAPKKVQYSDMKADIVGTTTLPTTDQTIKGSINELNQDLLDSCGYGVISGGVVAAQSTPNMTVQVTACTYKTSTGGRKTATANTSLAITAADTANPRVDIVYVNSSGVISYLQGTASSSPTAPNTPTGGTLLYQINVAANATSITNSNITDMRKMIISTDQLNAQLSDLMNNPMAQYSKTDTQTITTGNWTTLQWNSKIFDTNSFISQSNNSVITINKSGLYLINIGLAFDINSTNGTRNIRILKNNTEVIGYDSRNAWTSNSTRSNLSIVHYFNSGETFSVAGYQDSGTTVNLKVEAGFPLVSIAKIGEYV